jgi:hypothetical protein
MGLVAWMVDDGAELSNVVRELALDGTVDIRARPAPPA